MIVKRLSKKGRKIIIEFDDLSTAEFSYEIVLKYALGKEDEIDEKKFSEISREDNKFRIKNSAFRLLSGRAHSKKELRDKLLQRKFPKDIVDEILEELLQKNYLDDEKFAEKYVEEKSIRKKQSPLKLKMELIKRGINSNEAEKAVKNFYPADVILKNIEKHTTAKFRELDKKNLTEFQKKNKVIHSLLNKGYQKEHIFKVLSDPEFTDF